jgi:hypothetical protein
MSRWLIQLQGENMDLEEFPKSFPDGEVHAMEENGAYYLTGPALDAAASADEVLKIGTETLNQFSAVISLLWHSLRKPNISQVVQEDDAGARNAFVFVTGAASGRSKASAVAVDASGKTREPPTTPAQDLLAASKRSPNLREAINVWADPVRTWGRLYRGMDEIESHFQTKVDKAGLCSEPERTRFTRTANTAESAGLDARHGSGRFDLPSNPMSLEEATSFVSRLLERALRK